jgi:hypothetical protein
MLEHYLKITMQSLTQSWCRQADVYFIFVSLSLSLSRAGERESL